MCVVAIAWNTCSDWRLLVAGNRDEFHARSSAPLDRWNDVPDIIAGRDLVAGGSWLGVSDSGRFAVVTNIRDADGPDPRKASRGALVGDWLATGDLPAEVEAFNPFNLIVTDHIAAQLISNRPGPSAQLLPRGIHGLSNAVPDEHWPRKDRLVAQMGSWLEGPPANPETLFDLLTEETLPDRDAHPLFIRNPVYGTRCSSVVAVDHAGQGQIVERRFDATGMISGERKFEFNWAN